jgi:ATP-dependent exoDNAse (exonuclease V) alpha subunit
LHVADRADARVVFVGDRRQLPAVGRGGVLDMVAGWAPTQVELGAVHRFRTPDNQVDAEYADLSLRIRAGVDPEKVFDDLHESGHVQVWDTEADALGQLAWETARRHLDGVSQAVSVATNDDAAAVNEVVREQLVAAGAVDDTQVTHGSDGLRIGVGDQVMTRLNKPDQGVANRMTWTVTRIADEGSVQLYSEARRQQAIVDPDYVRDHLHLAYATTVHGVQGDTADHGDLVLSDATDAAAGYVGLTRGRYSNTVHIIAGSVDDAREQWVAAAGRNRADLGLDQARNIARSEARNYAPPHTRTLMQRHWSTTPTSGSSFAERMRRFSARLADDRARIGPARIDEEPAQDEWDNGIDEHEVVNDTPRQSGPSL